MYKIALINMPFANLSMPSIALTQLKAVVENQFKGKVSVDVHYLNHDFANYLGLRFYGLMLSSEESQNAGLGDWFFRQTAFPNLPDNAEAYLSRYFPFRTDEMTRLKSGILEKRRGLDQFFERMISKYALDQPDVVGFTSMFMQNVASFSLAKKIKERNPKVTTLMGGANCESPMGQVIVKHVEQIDYVFSGPGLKSFPDFVEHCLAREKWKCGSIKGVFTKKNCTFATEREAIGEELSIDVQIDLDYQPFMRVFEKNFPRSEIKPILLFETSRGCWWGERAHCTFCGLNGTSMAYRSMRPDLALKQFDSLFNFAPKADARSTLPCNMPGRAISEVYWWRPVTKLGPSNFATESPAIFHCSGGVTGARSSMDFISFWPLVSWPKVTDSFVSPRVTFPSVIVSTARSALKKSAARSSNTSRAAAAARCNCLAISGVLRLPKVPASKGVKSVSARTIRMADAGVRNSSATACASDVRMFCPISVLPE